jgi:hypothetical protein
VVSTSDDFGHKDFKIIATMGRRGGVFMPGEDSMGCIAAIGDAGASGTIGPGEGIYLDNGDLDTHVRPSRAGILTSIFESITTEAPATLPHAEALTFTTLSRRLEELS